MINLSQPYHEYVGWFTNTWKLIVFFFIDDLHIYLATAELNKVTIKLLIFEAFCFRVLRIAYRKWWNINRLDFETKFSFEYISASSTWLTFCFWFASKRTRVCCSVDQVILQVSFEEVFLRQFSWNIVKLLTFKVDCGYKQKAGIRSHWNEISPFIRWNLNLP